MVILYLCVLWWWGYGSDGPVSYSYENWRLVLTTFDTWTQSQFKVKMAANTLIPDYKVSNKNQFDN